MEIEAKKMGLKKVVILSVILIFFGIFFNIYSVKLKKTRNCINILNKKLIEGKVEIEKSYRDQRYAIYLVNVVSICCRKLRRFNELKSDQSVNFIFFVANNFSNNDIENFRHAFEIPEAIRIKKLGNNNNWLKLVGICGYKDDKITNIFILLNKKSGIEEIVRF